MTATVKVTWEWSWPDSKPDERGKRSAWVTATASDGEAAADVSTELYLDAAKPDQSLVSILPSTDLEASALVALARRCPN